MAIQVILNHITGTPEQVADGAEHRTASQTPDVHEILDEQFPVEALPAGRHAAFGTKLAGIRLTAMPAHVGLSVTHRNFGLVVLLPLLKLQHPLPEFAVP